MKKINIIYAVLIGAIILTVILYFSFRHVEGDGHDHGEKKESVAKEESVAHKEVSLNEAQYKAAEVAIGGFEMKNLSEVINANGYTKLPPQNQADVSVYMAGIVKSINVIEGEFVKKGQTLGTIESLEFTQLQEAYITAKSNLEYLTLEFNRQKILSDENVNARKIFEKTKSDFQIEKARLNSLQKQLSILNINNVDKVVSTIPVLAPISGYITEINIKLGSNAVPGTPIFNIVDNTKMHVDLLVYEKDLQKVKPGQTIQFVLTNQDNTEIKGKVFSVGKAFENETKSVAVHADIINDKQILIPGMYVNALIDIGTNKVPALPIESVIKADGREFIFILEEENDDEHADEKGKEKSFHFERIEVKSGTSQLGYVQVTPLQKLEPNAKIVLKGAYYLQSHLLKSEGGGGHSH
ncbi:efflux RND transporter periplasmic adaptor subunit [Flavobacterium sp. '19STA2R22 D10 B1']|uniref:efflux RND transporter periplasmic adaptor subunit n=1 Tax=Flavobacterium aerium TaxID=3037261 RepID=UPI00278BFE03|nr:efflux RND transporter periplasmic adaptor subunit [Flavobacterium sp. '19STA2R22 D10 B1']